MGKVDDQVFSLLKNSGKPLTLQEITNQTGNPPKKVFKALQKLFEQGKIDCDNRTRQYMIAKE
jgi:DNA-binding IclR family transcriptional regulator